ncbi:heme exporter protein CcmD [Roseomonas marmotae]|uniref:Heme exporter protein D n=1 Tax=Roseomonas marmotae TaxID=2768161 RepID=A0ABS3KI51_9PROT|nr:heme exporter protein CcmD [Roseomonas marmotae]MBO1076682.1 heme exporter protein CcmD [Roseomonas marmotae]QTI79856.1 heme exporter protein CcmD [Roseomonas marmotae]
MNQHWTYVAAAWGLAALLFGVLLADTLRRQSAARRRLAALEKLRPPGARGRTARPGPA